MFRSQLLVNSISVSSRSLPSSVIFNAVLGQKDLNTSQTNQVLASTFSAPRSVVFDQSDNLFVADSGNNRIIVVRLDSLFNMTPVFVIGQSSYVSNTAGTSPLLLRSPFALALDASGGLFVSDAENFRVLYFAYRSAQASRLFGQASFDANITGSTESKFASPRGIAVDSAGKNILNQTIEVFLNSFMQAICLLLIEAITAYLHSVILRFCTIRS